MSFLLSSVFGEDATMRYADKIPVSDNFFPSLRTTLVDLVSPFSDKEKKNYYSVKIPYLCILYQDSVSAVSPQQPAAAGTVLQGNRTGVGQKVWIITCALSRVVIQTVLIM